MKPDNLTDAQWEKVKHLDQPKNGERKWNPAWIDAGAESEIFVSTHFAYPDRKFSFRHKTCQSH